MKIKFLIMLFCLSLIWGSGCSISYYTREITPEEGQKAVEYAISQVGKPYVLGAQSPDVGFDCSGLVVWGYQQVCPNLLFKNQGKIYNDATVEALFSENTIPIPLEQARAGDIVFVRNKDGIVCHCGLFIEPTIEGHFKVVHASGGLGYVVIEEWALGEEVRGYIVHSIGRLYETFKE
ncbi:MAG: C40 family peptidase [Dictyoglomus turgidum]|uniref:C40 family peptidase n=1 Tax=Dictyoglomus turgidum TaxID=513050 RepID=UPI003C7764B4